MHNCAKKPKKVKVQSRPPEVIPCFPGVSPSRFTTQRRALAFLLGFTPRNHANRHSTACVSACDHVSPINLLSQVTDSHPAQLKQGISLIQKRLKGANQCLVFDGLNLIAILHLWFCTNGFFAKILEEPLQQTGSLFKQLKRIGKPSDKKKWETEKHRKKAGKA